MLTVLGGLAEFERELIRVRTSEGRARRSAWREARVQAKIDAAPAARGDQATRTRRADAGDCTELQRQP
jgi:DNA invertase Pin-like site-specific DNA recombinase